MQPTHAPAWTTPTHHQGKSIILPSINLQHQFTQIYYCNRHKSSGWLNTSIHVTATNVFHLSKQQKTYKCNLKHRHDKKNYNKLIPWARAFIYIQRVVRTAGHSCFYWTARQCLVMSIMRGNAERNGRPLVRCNWCLNSSTQFNAPDHTSSLPEWQRLFVASYLHRSIGHNWY